MRNLVKFKNDWTSAAGAAVESRDMRAVHQMNLKPIVRLASKVTKSWQRVSPTARLAGKLDIWFLSWRKCFESRFIECGGHNDFSH
jgi:hypothetical protein